MQWTTRLALSLLSLVVALTHAAAQQLPPPDTLKVDYFAYAHTTGAPDATLRVTNPGSTGGNICAAIYVFDPVQEAAECCSCLITPNGMRTLSVNTDLTNNPLTNVVLHTGTVSIVPTAPVNGTCPLPTSLTPTSGGVRSWATHIDRIRADQNDLTGFVGAAAPSQDATLSSYEEQQLQNDCYLIYLLGSGSGICTCGTGD